MFSYRHAFHAGNHADVLKHMALLACLRHLGQKDTGLTLVDTHAGAGLYRLDQDMAQRSGEAQAGIHRLLAALGARKQPEVLADYLDLLAQCNTPDAPLRQYPGSPWIAHSLLRAQDRLKLFEVHPTDARLLERTVKDWPRGKAIEVLRRDGFAGLRALLPPPTRRGMVLIDPSYELKTDYEAALDTVQDALQRFPTGTYLIWYPVIGRPEAHALGRKLKTLSVQRQRPWLRAELSVGHAGRTADSAHPGLRASAVHLINPPYTLAAQLREALPVVHKALREPIGASWSVEGSD